MSLTRKSLKEEFDTPSNFPYPAGSKPLWEYHNVYPRQGSSEPGWLGMDYKRHPKLFSEAIRKYILDGNVTDDGGFYVSDKVTHLNTLTLFDLIPPQVVPCTMDALR